MENLDIRPLAEADADDFVRLRLRALKEHPEAFGSSYEEERIRPSGEVAAPLRRPTDAPDDFTLGAFREGQLVGIASFSREIGQKVRHRGAVRGMYVPVEDQGRGIGRALITRAIQRARLADGLEQVGLAVATRNERARSLYASLGFETYGVEPNALIVEGQRIDEELMVLRLAPGR